MYSEINSRNTETVFEQLRALDTKARNNEIAIRQLVNAIGSLDERLRYVEAALTANRINNIGAGPTVKPEND